MQVTVNTNKVKITQSDIINKGEYNITPIEFTFSNEYLNLTKRAIFTSNNKSFVVEINNNECIIPEEVLRLQGNVILGVYAYENNNEKLVKRYSPGPAEFFVDKGSYIDTTKTTIPPQEAKDLIDKVNDIIDEVQQKLDNGEFDGQDGVGISNIVFNNDYTMTITLTNGTTYTSPVLKGDPGTPGQNGQDGKDGQNGYTPVKGIDYWTPQDKAEILNELEPEIPHNTSDLNNDSGFITNLVNDLTNYYLKNETYTKQEVNSLIGQIATISIQVVEELPEEGQSNIIYLVPTTDPKEQNIKDEFLWVNNDWEQIGSTAIDLTGYATESWVNTQISNFLTQTQIESLITTALTNYYTKTQIDTLLNGKVDKSSFVYDSITETLTITI